MSAQAATLESICPSTVKSGWSAREDARAGNPFTLPPATGTVLGYTDRGSVTCGEQFTVHLSSASTPQNVRVAAYRIGTYQGRGARLVSYSKMTKVSPQPIPAGDVWPHTVAPSWPVSASFTPTYNWVPGFYLLVPQFASGVSAGPAIPLVVRNPVKRAPVLFQASTLTWSAYNTWGGWSLYHGPVLGAGAEPARVVALHRPLTGNGYEQMAAMDLPVVRQLEAMASATKLDVDYTTDVAVHRDGRQLRRYNEVVYGGHSEYWTGEMYDGLNAALNSGVNVAFLGANNLYWHSRLEGTTPSGEPANHAVYRGVGDPLENDPAQATLLWSVSPLDRSPSKVTGQSYAAISVRGSYQVLSPPSWFTAGTTVRNGTLLLNAIGNEGDGFKSTTANPTHTQLLTAGLVTGPDRTALVSTNYTSFPSGSGVFAAGTTFWACIPLNACPGKAAPPATSKQVAQLTRNVFVTFAKPTAGRRFPATRTKAWTVENLRPLLGKDARSGTFGSVVSVQSNPAAALGQSGDASAEEAAQEAAEAAEEAANGLGTGAATAGPSAAPSPVPSPAASRRP